MMRSQVINNDLNPKWDEDFKILVHEPEHQVGAPVNSAAWLAHLSLTRMVMYRGSLHGCYRQA